MITYKIAGQIFDDIEKQDITITIGGDGLDADISNIKLFEQSKNFIQNLIASGNVFDKIPFELFYENTKIFEGYISFRNSHNLAEGCSFIEFSVTKNDSKKGLEDISDLVTVIGGIASGDVITFPISYQLSSIPDGQAVAIAVTGLFLTTYVFQEKLKNIIQKISETVSNPFTVNMVISLGIEIAYTTVLFTAFVKYLTDLFKALISPVKEAPTFNLTSALNGLLSRIGYSLQSDFLFLPPVKDLHIVHTIDTDGNIINQWTLRDLLFLTKQLFNCEILVNGTTVTINKNRSFSSPAFTVNDYVLTRRELDLSECPSSILLRFAYDGSDKNTVTNGVGNSLQALFNRHGEAKINEISVARAKRKDKLTLPEEILKSILEIADTVLAVITTTINAAIYAINAAINFFNRIIRALRSIGIRLKINITPLPALENPDFSQKIADRIGGMLVEADTWGVNKLLLFENKKISPNHKEVVNAKYFFDNFWQERYVYEKWAIQTPLCFDSLINLSQNRFVQLGNDVFKVIEAQFNINSNITNLTLQKIVKADVPPQNIILQ
jgi:hypothetical protein